MTELGTSMDFSRISELAQCGITTAAVAVGVFDGVHKGHQKLLTELLTVSEKLNAVPAVMTFYPHPRSLLTENPPTLLYPPSEKLRLLHEYGAKAVVTVDFTPEFSRLSPLDFLEQSVFAGPAAVRGICVGRHWRFGAKASGDAAFLETLSKERGFHFSAVEELCMDDGQVISSTAIREAVAGGDLELAEKMLGRRYTLSGTVEHGYRAAGEKLKAPTANLKITDGVLPRFGVYAAFAHLPSGERFPAAVNIGISPTFREQYGEIAPRVEVHLLNGFHGDLYGRKLKLELAGFVRGERTFSGAEELKQQIVRDIARITELLERS